MKRVVDLHTHSLVSGHAYSTFLENVKVAAEKGIEVLGTSDHGPNMPGGPHIFYFNNMETVPREIDGVTILRGCEANIIDLKGTIDIPRRTIHTLDYVIGSLHEVCIKPGNRDKNTIAVTRAMESGNIQILGHLGNPSFPIWEETVIRRAKELDILIEINNGSFFSREGSEVNCIKIIKLCQEYGVKILLGSDAHICYNVGEFSKVEELLEQVKIDEELILNSRKLAIIQYLKTKGKLMDLKLD